MEIDAGQLEAARRNPEVQKFLKEAISRDEQMRREGLIHP
jgi:hypothetical protein